MSVPWNSPVMGGGRTTNIYRREGDTVSQGGAYPVDWYGFKLKRLELKWSENSTFRCDFHII